MDRDIIYGKFPKIRKIVLKPDSKVFKIKYSGTATVVDSDEASALRTFKLVLKENLGIVDIISIEAISPKVEK